MSNGRCIGAWILRGSQRNTVSSIQMMWGQPRKPTGPQQTRVAGWQSKGGMRFSMGQGQIRATGVPFPTSLRFTKKVSLHNDWLGGKWPKLLPLQESVSPPAHRWAEFPAISLEGFWKISPKERKIASLKRLDCYNLINIVYIKYSEFVFLPKNCI